MLISLIRNYSGGSDSGRLRKKGVCDVNFDPSSVDLENGEKTVIETK